MGRSEPPYRPASQDTWLPGLSRRSPEGAKADPPRPIVGEAIPTARCTPERTLVITPARLFFSLSLSLLLAIPAAAAPVTGRVLDPDGRPVPGATVMLSSGGTLLSTTVTDANGRFDIEAPDGQPSDIRIALAGFRAEPRTIDGRSAVDLGDLRLSMLTKLSQKNYRLSQLSSELEATMQEAHRNMTRLVDSGLVSKDRDGELVLTAYGRTVVAMIPGYEFLYNNRDFFIDHSLGDLPPKFIQRMGAFSRCEMVRGVMAILQRWKNLY